MQPQQGKSPTSGVLEVAHVFFMDIVAYSTKFMDEQRDSIAALQGMVRGTQSFQAAESAKEVISLPTGDGMALVFFGDPTRAADCALETAAALMEQPTIKLRMGLHTGPVYRVADINTNLNVAGGGINIAQRIMNEGDPGQILVSSAMAEMLCQLARWKPLLHDLGTQKVKHGAEFHFYTLCSGQLGLSGAPSHWAARPGPRPTHRRMWPWAVTAALVVIAGVVVAVKWPASVPVPPATATKPTPPPAVVSNEIQYSISVQRYKDGKVFRDPFQLAGEILFEEDYRIALNVLVPRSGYLYLLNDGPLANGKPSINVLYPEANQSARVEAGGTLRFPPQEWIRFDQQSGAEKLYIVWSVSPFAAGERWKDRTAEMKNGHVVIEDSNEIASIREVLAHLLIPAEQVTKDEEKRFTGLRSSNEVFAHLIRLEHH